MIVTVYIKRFYIEYQYVTFNIEFFFCNRIFFYLQNENRWIILSQFLKDERIRPYHYISLSCNKSERNLPLTKIMSPGHRGIIVFVHPNP